MQRIGLITDGRFGIRLYACVDFYGLGRLSQISGISYAILTTIISAIIGTASKCVSSIQKIGMWLLDMLMVIPTASCLVSP